MVNSVLSQLEMKDEEDIVLFTSMYIRRMAVRHFLEHYEQLKENISFGIEQEYGRIDSEEGPYSIMTWCQAMISDKVYGDLSLLKLIASMWSVRITVVRCDTLSEVRIRHDLPLEQAEIVLLYNGVPVMGHYCAGIKGSSDNTFMKLDCKRVVRNLKYEKEVDVIERLERKDVLWDLEKDTDVMEGCKILVDKKEYDVLKKKAAQLDQINLVLRGSCQKGQLQQVASQEQSTCQYKGKEDVPGVKKMRMESQFQEPSDVPEYNVGDTECKCGHKAKTTHALQLHIMKMHKGKYLYTCEICQKGFTQKDGYKTHQLVHGPQSEKISCTHKDCDVTFVSKRTLNAHLKTQHGERRFFVCCHCTKTYSTRGILSEHVKGCKQNPYRVPTFCDLCQEGTSPTFYLLKRVMEHKRDIH